MFENLRARISPYVIGMAAFIRLRDHVHVAASNQSSALGYIDPIQGRIDHAIQTHTKSLLEKHLMNASWYTQFKQDTVDRLLPSTEVFIERLQWGERVSENLENRITRFAKQSQLTQLTSIIAATILFGGMVSYFTHNPVKLFWITGGFLSVALNSHAISLFAQDTKNVCMVGTTLLQNSLSTQARAHELGKDFVKGAYQPPKTNARPEVRILRKFVTKTVTYIAGTEEEALELMKSTIDSQVCERIQEFEVEQRRYYFSRATDASVMTLTATSISQLARLFFTNLTGLGLVAAIFYATYSFLPLSAIECSLYTPLLNAWNHVFPFSFFPFEETCHTYRYFLYASDTIKWGLRFFVWNKMIQQWKQSRKRVMHDLTQPIDAWTQEKWRTLHESMNKVTGTVHQAVIAPLQSQFKKAPKSPSLRRAKRIIPKQVAQATGEY